MEAKGVAAFFAALSPVELAVYQRALAAQQQTATALDRACAQHLERWRDQAALAQRQCERVAPAKRLVAAELAHRGEGAVRARKQAEAADPQRRHPRVAPLALPADLQGAVTAFGQKLPALWTTPVRSRTQKKALRRCLLDKVLLPRVVRDQGQTRLVGKGGDTTTFALPLTVGSRAELSSAQALEQRLLTLHAAGKSDQEIAEPLTAAGFRAPQRPSVLRSPVQILRLKPRVFITHSQSHPRRIAGFLPVSQLARGRDLSVQWLSARITNGHSQIQQDPTTGLYWFPAHPTTLERLKQRRAGHLQQVGF